MRTYAISYSIYGTLIVASACAFALSVWFVLHTVDTQRTAAQRAAEEGEAGRESTYAASVRALLRDTQDERARLSNLTKGVDIVGVIDTIEAVARDARVKMVIDAVNPSGGHPTDSTLAAYTIAMHGEGSYAQARTFVALMETVPFPLSVEHIVFEKRDMEGWSVTLRARVHLDKPSTATTTRP